MGAKGKSEKSARESIVIYVDNELFGVKWRNLHGAREGDRISSTQKPVRRVLSP
jgi:hypothetical protein